MPNKILAVCLDCGDTLIDELTEKKTRTTWLTARI